MTLKNDERNLHAATHMAHGMHGLILVAPSEGLPKVDREYYVMQSEFYSTGDLGKKGLQVFDAQKKLDGKPEYIVFNGWVGGVNEKMASCVGETVRIYFGNGGVNDISSFHVIGEIFDKVYAEADLVSPPLQSVQTTAAPWASSAYPERTILKSLVARSMRRRRDIEVDGRIYAKSAPTGALFAIICDEIGSRAI